MFGLTEITEQLANQINEPVRMAIIPTFVLPFTILGMILTSLATWVAALFGVELKAEGPKRLFEVLMKPKILLLAVVSNAFVYGAIVGGKYLYNKPLPVWTIELRNKDVPGSALSYPDAFPMAAQVSAGVTSGPTMTFKLLWQADLGAPVFGGVTLSGSSLFVGTDNGKVEEIELSSGKKVRSFLVGKPVTPTPLILNNTLYVGEGVHDTHHARVYSFNLATGHMEKTFETKGHIERSPVIGKRESGESTLLIPAGRDGIYAVNPSTLEKLWRAEVGHVDSWPLVEGNRVYVGSGLEKGFGETGTTASAIDLETGKILWAKELPTSSWGLPFFWRDLVCYGVGDVYRATTYGQISCYKKSNGDEDLAINTRGALIGQPVVDGDFVYVSDFHGNVYKLDMPSKSIVWRVSVPTKGFSYASVVLDGHGHFVLPGEQGLYVYSLESQKMETIWKPEGNQWKGAYANIQIHDRVWYFADKKGMLRAVRVE